MPSSYTANYQLNQWVKSDQVKMEDFNSDNAKIDSAIKAQADGIAAERSARIAAVEAECSARAAAVQAARDACPLVLLRSVTLTSSVSRYDLSLTGFNWEDYGEVIIYMLLKSGDNTSNLNILLNGRSGDYLYTGREGNQATLRSMTVYSGGSSASCRLLRSVSGFQCLWLDNAYWRETFYTEPRDWYLSRDKYTTMNFVCQNTAYPLAAGTRFTILGVRA